MQIGVIYHSHHNCGGRLHTRTTTSLLMVHLPDADVKVLIIYLADGWGAVPLSLGTCRLWR